MARRVYTDDDKARVLAVLTANNGNVKRTARDTQVAEQTVRDWKKAAERGTLPAKVVSALPVAAQDFMQKAETIRDLAMDELEIALRQGDVKPAQLVPVIGMLTEKILLVKGQATSRTEHVSTGPTPEEFGQRLMEFMDNSFKSALEREADIVDVEFEEQAQVALPAAPNIFE